MPYHDQRNEELKMAEEKGANADAGGNGASASKQGSPRKGARSASETKPPRSGRGGKSGGSSRRAKSNGPDLRKDLREFASARPDGWGHDDWLRFLEDLQQRGHNINDRDQIGLMLERERLSLMLEKVPGVGPRRVQNIVEKYGYVWRLREADADEISREAGVPRQIADKVVQAISPS